MSVRLSRRTIAATVLATGAVLAVGAASASAHVGTDKTEITAGESTTLTFSIGHGCEDEPTTSMSFEIPESVLNAAPQVKAGWTITTERAELVEPVESGHGEEQTDRVSVITFTAEPGNEVDSAYRDSFTLAFRAPEAEGQLFFKVIQGCATGENAWIDEWDGTGPEPESPAPSVMVAAATTTTTTTTTTATATATATTATTVDVTDGGDDSSDGSPDGLAIAGFGVGALGLVAGGTALVMVRKHSGT